MAVVSFHHVGWLTGISPGATHHWWWNNAPGERVWSISVDAMLPLRMAYPGAAAKVEVTRIESRENYHGGGSSGFEREVHWWVKNTGTLQADYLIHMATVRE
jgi:hypothetical protein